MTMKKHMFEGCRYHDMRDHLEFLAYKFGDPPEHDDDELPLFPDSEGNVVTADAMLALVEEIAQLIGEALF